jgi:hypothetical protein
MAAAMKKMVAINVAYRNGVMSMAAISAALGVMVYMARKANEKLA